MNNIDPKDETQNPEGSDEHGTDETTTPHGGTEPAGTSPEASTPPEPAPAPDGNHKTPEGEDNTKEGEWIQTKVFEPHGMANGILSLPVYHSEGPEGEPRYRILIIDPSYLPKSINDEDYKTLLGYEGGEVIEYKVGRQYPDPKSELHFPTDVRLQGPKWVEATLTKGNSVIATSTNNRSAFLLETEVSILLFLIGNTLPDGVSAEDLSALNPGAVIQYKGMPHPTDDYTIIVTHFEIVDNGVEDEDFEDEAPAAEGDGEDEPKLHTVGFNANIVVIGSTVECGDMVWTIRDRDNAKNLFRVNNVDLTETASSIFVEAHEEGNDLEVYFTLEFKAGEQPDFESEVITVEDLKLGHKDGFIDLEEEIDWEQVKDAVDHEPDTSATEHESDEGPTSGDETEE